MKQGESSVREYNTMFLAGGLVDKHDEPTLVKMYQEGLRENIRSEWSPLNPVEGSDDESDSKVDLEDYQEYIEEHHKSDSESSEDSK
ncbi:BnaC07g06810D [Brassica napus]|uniref:Retrotransposon gag domain-containing protein n=2 Tax=Brassica TaxID=3705 RepID=A0A3P6ESL8_BRAOL|nr:unnamed protein product [Brassica napus]CDY20832.1 BnaC07g06810D [Brassica napus]VDD35372.1 unnamed protein product [Brassica oleracea]